MKEPKNIIFLIELIEREYSWRISELSNFRNSLISQANLKIQKASLRAGITLLYAHWEGFIKKISNLYYEYVRLQDLIIDNLNDSFLCIYFKKELDLFSNSKKLESHLYVINKIFDIKKEKAFFSSKSPIKTSNLKFELFKDICLMLGINTSRFESAYKRNYDRSLELTINEDLVKQRNLIAHGEYLQITLVEFKKLYDVIINGILYNFKEIVIDCAQNKHYLKNK